MQSHIPHHVPRKWPMKALAADCLRWLLVAAIAMAAMEAGTPSAGRFRSITPSKGSSGAAAGAGVDAAGNARMAALSVTRFTVLTPTSFLGQRIGDAPDETAQACM